MITLTENSNISEELVRMTGNSARYQKQRIGKLESVSIVGSNTDGLGVFMDQVIPSTSNGRTYKFSIEGINRMELVV